MPRIRSTRHDVDEIMLKEAYEMQNDYSYYTNSTKTNVISVCVCVPSEET